MTLMSALETRKFQFDQRKANLRLGMVQSELA